MTIIFDLNCDTKLHLQNALKGNIIDICYYSLIFAMLHTFFNIFKYINWQLQTANQKHL